LNGLTTPLVNEQKSSPVSRNETTSGEDKVANANVLQVLVDTRDTFVRGRAETDGLQDDTGVKTKAVESNLIDKLIYEPWDV
jgi:hypothetical protein